MLGLDLVIGGAMKVLDKLIPDKEEKARIEVELFRMKQAGEFKEIDAELERIRTQTDINKTEAAHADVFVAGWRPAIGWVFALALAWQFIVAPAIQTIFILYTGHGLPVPLPTIDGMLWELGFGMLGLGGLRTLEKIKGVAR